ncbi:MAG: hypothetical protein RLZZ262_2095, partial [Bacteroidota bacterium]
MNYRITSYFIAFCIGVLATNCINGQGQMGYVFTAELDVYEPLTDGDVVWSDSVLVDHAILDIPETEWNGTIINSLLISSNGWIGFGADIEITEGEKLFHYGGLEVCSFTAIAFGHILQFAETGTPAVLYDIIGDELIVEYRDVRRIGVAGERLNFQIRANLSNSNIVLSYGAFVVGLEAPNLRNKPSSSYSSELEGLAFHEFVAGIRGQSDVTLSTRGGLHWSEPTISIYGNGFCSIDETMSQDRLASGSRYVFNKVSGIVGCQDEAALNYIPNAEYEGLCAYHNYYWAISAMGYACTDELACNFDPEAVYPSAYCSYCNYGCTNEDALNYDPDASIDQGYCITDPLGTTPEFAIPLDFQNGLAMELWSNQAGDGMTMWGNTMVAHYSFSFQEFTAIRFSLKGLYHGSDMVMEVHSVNGGTWDLVEWRDDVNGSIPEIVLWAEADMEYVLSVYCFAYQRFANHLLVAKVFEDCATSLGGPGEYYCEDESDNLWIGYQFNSLTWIIDGEYPATSGYTLNVGYFDPGVHTFRMIFNHPMCPIDTTFMVTILNGPEVMVPDDIFICPGDTVLVQLQADTEWQASWTGWGVPPPYESWANGTELQVSGNSEFEVEVIDNNNCSAQDSFTVSFGQTNLYSLEQDPFLNGNSVNIAGDADHQWFLNGEIIEGANDNVYTPTVTGDYSVLNTSGSCSQMSETIYFNYEEVLCNQLFESAPQIMIQDEVLFSTSTYELQWLFNGAIIEGATSSEYTPLSTGYYSLLHGVGDCEFESPQVF